MNIIERNPGKTVLLLMVFCWTMLYITNDTATIEMIDGEQYVTAINGKDIIPRKPNRYDIELNWEYK